MVLNLSRAMVSSLASHEHETGKLRCRCTQTNCVVNVNYYFEVVSFIPLLQGVCFGPWWLLVRTDQIRN